MADDDMSITPGQLTPEQIEERDSHTIQGLYESVYIKEANDTLFGALNSLTSALSISSKSLDVLNSLQTMHNNVTVEGLKSFEDETGFEYDNPELDEDDYSEEYQNDASGYFGKPIDPQFIYKDENDPGFDKMAKDLAKLKKKIEDEILPYLDDQNPDAKDDPTSMYSKLKTVAEDIPDGNPPSYDDVKKWALDAYDVHNDEEASNAGEIQNNLTAAITSAQSFNNTQSENVRRYLFVFEEYYKSAAAGLQSITQIITKMAGNISRS